VQRLLSFAHHLQPLCAGEEHVYLSSDSVMDEDEHSTLYPPEWLHTLQPSGLPAHALRLKVGVPIMLLRNLNAALGLANGTRLVVDHLMPHIIQATIATGRQQGTQVLIPRITIQPSDSTLPFTLSRRQFPVRPAFAMTINKAQGQTFERVGIFLPHPCFSHGQLYVAMSRVGEAAGVTIMALPESVAERVLDTTTNVVYSEVLQP